MADQPQAKYNRADDAPVGRLVADVVAAGARQTVNGLESLIRFVSPRWAAHREQFRRVLSYYEAARPTTYRRQRREPGRACGSRPGIWSRTTIWRALR